MTDIVSIDKDSAAPLYVQIYRQIRRQILQGTRAPGSRAPSSRRLAVACGVARKTVLEAYAQLEAEGFLVTRPGAGTYVCDALPAGALAGDEEERPFSPPFSAWGREVLALRPETAPARPMRPAIDFGFGRSFPHIFPYDVWRKLLARYLSTDDAMLSRYGSTAGFYPLRAAIAEYLAQFRGVSCAPEQVVIVNGAQQALDILVRLLLHPGDQVLMESPGYTDAYTLFRAYGAVVDTVAVDDEGLPVENISESSRARLLFVTPANQFPRGGAMPLARRLALLQWAQRRQALIVEDDYDGALRYDGRPLSALQGLDKTGHVAYLGSFSKVLFPALRLAYVALPPALVAPFVQAKGLIDRGAPTLTQAAVSDFIKEGYFAHHLRRLRAAYGERRRRLLTAVDRYLPPQVAYSSEAAGLHVMLRLPPEWNEADLIRQAAEAEVGVYPGAPYHLQKPAPPSILLGFSGLDVEEIEEGVRRLGLVMQ